MGSIVRGSGEICFFLSKQYKRDLLLKPIKDGGVLMEVHFPALIFSQFLKPRKGKKHLTPWVKKHNLLTVMDFFPAVCWSRLGWP